MDRAQRRWGAWVATLPLAFLMALFVWPLLRLAQSVVFNHSASSMEGAGTTLTGVANATVTTLLLAGMGTLLTLAFALPATYAVHKMPSSRAAVLDAVLSAPFVMPTPVVAIAFLSVSQHWLPWLGGSGGTIAIVAALAFFNIAVVLKTVGPAIQALDRRLITVSRALGASTLFTLRKVVWPALRRSIGESAMVTFVMSASSFGLVLILGGTRVRTLEVSSYIEVTAFFNLPGAAVFALTQAALVALLSSAMARQPSQMLYVRVSPLSGDNLRTTTKASLFAAFPALVLVATPLLSLVVTSSSAVQNFAKEGMSSWLFGSPGITGFLEAAFVSMTTATLSGLTATVLGTAVVVSSMMSPSWRWIRALSMAPLAVSSVVIGIGLLLGLAIPLRNVEGATSIVLIAAQTLVALPIVVRIIGAHADAVPPRLIVAASSLGAGPWMIVRRVLMPNMRPAIATALGIATAVALGEFGASLFLARPDLNTIPTLLMRYLARPGTENMALAALTALCLATLSGLTMLVVQRLGRTPGGKRSAG